MTVSSENITVGPVTLAFIDSQATSLFSPRQNSGGRDTYGCSIVFGEEVRQKLQPIIDQVGAQAFPNEWANPAAQLHRGIHPTQPGKPQLAERGPWFANVSTGYPPQIVDSKMQPIINTLDPATGRKPLYDGVVCYVSVNAYSFTTKQRGVSIGLGAILKYADAEPLNLGGGVNVQEAFANLPPAPAGAPAPQQAPQGYPQPQGAPQGYPQPQGAPQGYPQPQGAPQGYPQSGQQAYDPQTGQPIPPFRV